MRRVDLADLPSSQAQSGEDSHVAGSDAATVAMRRDTPTAQATPGSEENFAGADAATMAMPIVKPPVADNFDDAKTMALPIQKRPDQDATQRMRTDAEAKGTDRVVTPPARPSPLSKPPSTPRPASGPKQAGAQGPTSPQQNGPHQGGPPQNTQAPNPTEQTHRSPQRPPNQPRQVASAPSPADTQLTRPAQTLSPRPPQPRQIAPPQRIEPPSQADPAPAADASESGGRSKRWLLAVLGAAAVLVIALIAVMVTMVGGADNSPEAKVRATIDEYTDALQAGDLAALRTTTCGPLHEFYQGIPEDQFASVHQLSKDRQTIPVVASVDAIKITDATAIAQATVYIEADPGKRSARTFDLEQSDDGWKVCDPSGTTP